MTDIPFKPIPAVRQLNRAERRAAAKKTKKKKIPSIAQFDMMTEEQQIKAIRQLRPEFKIEDLTNPKGEITNG